MPRRMRARPHGCTDLLRVQQQQQQRGVKRLPCVLRHRVPLHCRPRSSLLLTQRAQNSEHVGRKEPCESISFASEQNGAHSASVVALEPKGPEKPWDVSKETSIWVWVCNGLCEFAFNIQLVTASSSGEGAGSRETRDKRCAWARAQARDVPQRLHRWSLTKAAKGAGT